jgi:hypothetical protein
MHARDWNICLPLHFGHVGAPALVLDRALVSEPMRDGFESFIQTRFKQAHNAHISHFMPELRLAMHESLFLERYLDEPIEQAVERATDGSVDRQGIVEVGNLGASSIGSARLSIITITWLLAMGGLQWVAFTGNAGLVNSFNRLGLRPVTLGPADPLRLGNDRHAWGSYYDTQPSVHVGDVRSGFEHLSQSGLFERFGLPLGQEQCCHVA